MNDAAGPRKIPTHARRGASMKKAKFGRLYVLTVCCLLGWYDGASGFARFFVRQRRVFIPVSMSRALSSAEENDVDSHDEPKKRKRRQLSKSDEVIHWLVEGDRLIVERADSEKGSTISHVRFTVRGNPLPLRRHRTSRGFVYNPSSQQQASFRSMVCKLLFEGQEPESAIFADGTCLSMTIAFRMKRPKAHFVASRPGEGRMKKNAPSQTSVVRTDVDNLAKFVLDSLNGVVYEDDRQVSSLHVTKFLDNHDECLGSTEVSIHILEDEDLPKLLEKTFDLL